MLSGDALSNTLHAIATGNRDRAINLVRTTDELDDAARARLDPIVADRSAPADEVMRRFGDALRELGANRALVNECYRAAFYLSDAAADLLDNPLFAYFVGHRSGRLLDKWVHYFPIYTRHFGPYRGRRIRILEVGVYRGGSLDMWHGDRTQADHVPAAPLLAAFRNPRVVAFVGVWFGLNLLFGLGSLSIAGANQAVAWEAHLGGFLAGLLLFSAFDPVRRAPVAEDRPTYH